jgi:hypothetical protein
MATATSNKPLMKTPMSKRRMAAYAGIGVLVIALLLLAFNFTALKGNAKLGTGYAAHVTCSCRYIEGRSLEDCAKDMEAGTEIVSISDDPENKRITTSVAFLATAIAEKRGEFGCYQLNDEEMDAL